MRKKTLFIRQQDIINTRRIMQFNITIIGCGGIGSPTAILLAKMGIEFLRFYDHDKIEEHNLPNQFHKVSDIGKNKAEELAELVNELSGINAIGISEKYKDQELTEIVISAVDSMKARKVIYNQFKKQENTKLLIDARMAGQFFNIFCIDKQSKESMKKYEKTIVRDEYALQQACTAKAIIYNVFGIASFIGNIIKRIANKEEVFLKYSLDYRNMLTQTFKLEDFKPENQEEVLYVNTTDKR